MEKRVAGKDRKNEVCDDGYEVLYDNGAGRTEDGVPKRSVLNCTPGCW